MNTENQYVSVYNEKQNTGKIIAQFPLGKKNSKFTSIDNIPVDSMMNSIAINCYLK